MVLDPSRAWQPYRPDDSNPWDIKKVGHLYRRAAFGANYRQLDEGVAAGPEKTIAGLLSGGPALEVFNRQMAEMTASLNLVIDEELRGWWIFRILQSPFPLEERMTLFWHNHFATSNAKVQNLRYMLKQNELIRRNALGSFRTMLEEMSKDPAMMVWLDTSLSKKGQANENYARELMELFSLGIGHYTETDVREAARAFTGCEIRDGKFRLNTIEHDSGDKTFLSKRGSWGCDDIVRICLEQEAAPRFIAGKLFRFFISDTIDASHDLIDPLAAQLRTSDFDLRGARRDDPPLEPVFLAGSLSLASQIAGRFRGGHRSRAGRQSRRRAALRCTRGPRAAALFSAVGQGLERRHAMDQFEHTVAAETIWRWRSLRRKTIASAGGPILSPSRGNMAKRAMRRLSISSSSCFARRSRGGRAIDAARLFVNRPQDGLS